MDDPQFIAKAIQELSDIDPVMSDLIDKYGTDITIQDRSDYAEYIASIIGQRVSLVSARKSRKRLYELTGEWDFSPESLEPHLPNLESALKIDSKRAGAIRNYHATRDPMTSGIGPWTRAIVSMKTDPDILPPNDIALLKTVHRLYGLSKRPTQAELAKIAEAWRPYRSIACYYLYKV